MAKVIGKGMKVEEVMEREGAMMASRMQPTTILAITIALSP